MSDKYQYINNIIHHTSYIMEQKAKTIVCERFLKIIDSLPDEDWDWDEISRNPIVTMENLSRRLNCQFIIMSNVD